MGPSDPVHMRVPVPESNRPALPATNDGYNQFVRGVVLESIRMTSCEMRAPRAPDGRAVQPTLQVRAPGYENVDRQVRLTHELDFLANYDDDGVEALHVRIGLEAIYTSDQPMTDVIFAMFHRVNLPLNTWPYFREALQNALVRMGWPPFSLPVFRVAPRDEPPPETSGAAPSSNFSESTGEAVP